MVYDTFMFSHELDLLEFRLDVLDSVVDKFILVESRQSHTRKTKPLYFADNAARFARFKDKLASLTVDLPMHENPFVVNWQYRNFIQTLLSPHLSKDDIVLHGDMDEIPNPNILRDLISSGITEPLILQNDLFYYYFNLRDTKRNSWERATIVTKLPYLRETLAETREHWYNYKTIPLAGWHYTFLMSPEDIVRKMNFYAHSDEFSPDQKTIEYVKARIAAMESVHAESARTQLERVDLNVDNCPQFLLNNASKYKQYIL
jgi:beta-1,4-mannosyl-glycoprotein beta-1,4-N-acetylglucosaminyltransferase